MRKRIIITISFSFSIRYLIRTGLLNAVRKFAEPVVVLTWQEDDLIQELKNEGYEVYILPSSIIGNKYADIRKKIDIWFDNFQLKSPSKKIQQDYLDQYIGLKRKTLRNTRVFYNVLKHKIPGYTSRLMANEEEELYKNTNYKEILAFTKKLKAQAVLTITPFHRQEDIFLRTCKNEGMHMMTSIHSFDNITKRGWIPITYDTYMVWNTYNKAELHRIYPETKNKSVYITGAPQFDLFFDRKNCWPKVEWKRRLGLPETDKKIILYAGGPIALFPNEPQYLKHLSDAIDNNLIENKPIILFRCHPIDDIKRWQEVLGNTPNVKYESSWTGKEKMLNSNITEEDIQKLCSTLCYTDVHINLCSTMTVDGSVFNKPQIGPAYDEVNISGQLLLQDMYLQEHFLPIINSGALVLSKSRKEFIADINNALINPENNSTNRKNALLKIISFDDGKSTLRVAELIDNNVNKGIQG